MQTSTEATKPSDTALAVPLCDCNCNEPALYAYVWEWGEKGQCCQKHHFELNQAAGNISRSIQCSPLQPVAAAPLLRDERVALISKGLAAEAELEEAKSRGLDMHRQNVGLSQQVQAMTTVKRETDAQLKDNRIRIEKLTAELEAANAERANLADEISRLKMLVPTPEAPKKTK